MFWTRVRRGAGIAFGVLTHILFAVTVWYLFWFLKDGSPDRRSGALAWNALLALQFAVVHSVLLLPAVRRRLGRRIRAEFYGCFFCVITCVGLLIVVAGWRASPMVLWEARSWTAAAITAAFYGSWAALFYSLSLTGLGYQTGFTPWLYWLRRQPAPRREFRPRGAYRLIRHPVYLSLLGLLWFTPVMTLDRAVLVAIWTVYVFVGSYLKDERLAHYLGESYRAYQTKVTGYPLFIGPLGRLRRKEAGGTRIIDPSSAPVPAERASSSG